MQEPTEIIDRSLWLPEGEPIITPERAAKGDVFTGPDCGECNGTGKVGSTTTACRACKGKGWIGSVNASRVSPDGIRFAQVQVRNILRHLEDNGVITDQNAHDGRTFEVWRILFNATTGLAIRPNPIYTPQIRSLKLVIVEDGLYHGDYEDLIRSLIPWQRQIIIFSIDVTASEHNRWLAARHHAAYRTAFGRLSEVMERLRDAERKKHDESAC